MCVFPTADQWPAIVTAWAAFAWPMIVATAIFFYRNAIADLLRRIVIHLTPNGVGVSGTAPQQNASAGPKTGLPRLNDQPVNDAMLNDPALKFWRDGVAKAVEQLEKDEGPQTVRSRMISAMAWQGRRDSFWFMTRSIYGSQVELMERLNSPAGSLSTEVARGIHRAIHELRAGDRASSFDVWLQFLIDGQIIERLGDQIRITPIGRAYVEFLREFGETQNTKVW